MSRTISMVDYKERKAVPILRYVPLITSIANNFSYSVINPHHIDFY